MQSKGVRKQNLGIRVQCETVSSGRNVAHLEEPWRGRSRKTVALTDVASALDAFDSLVVSSHPYEIARRDCYDENEWMNASMNCIMTSLGKPAKM